MAAKYKLEKFTGKNDFGLWRVKMQALLVKQGLADALYGEKALPPGMTDYAKKELL